MPDELESFYTRTIQRLPQHNKSRAYMLLEIMNRLPELTLQPPIGPAEIYSILACARGNTFQDCRDLSTRSEQEFEHATDDKIQELLELSGGLLEIYSILACARGNTFQDCRDLSTRSEQKFEHATDDKIQDLLELSGGLLEIQISCEKTKVTKRLQFMHKTARDFVGTSGFAQTILRERCLIQSENGYTSLFKWIVVICVRTIFRLFSDARPSNSYRSLALYFQLVQLAHMDEKTTGRPLTTFIDSIPAAFWQQLASLPCFAWLHGAPVLGMVSSFTFAVSANLQLFVRSKLSAIDPQCVISESVIRGPLIGSATLAIRLAHWDPPLLPSVEGLNLAKMIKLLLDHGFRDTRHNDGLNAFGLCFWLVKNFRSNEAGSEFDRIVHTLIIIGKQDPNEVYSLSTRQDDVRLSYTCAAIHISGPGMTRMLLQNGADPNLLDENGNTAMDIIVQTLSSRNSAHSEHEFWFNHNQVGRWDNKSDILLAYGGTITRASARVLLQQESKLRDALGDATMRTLLALEPLKDTSRSRGGLVRGNTVKTVWKKVTRKFR